jgi:hypothetical protein
MFTFLPEVSGSWEGDGHFGDCSSGTDSPNSPSRQELFFVSTMLVVRPILFVLDAALP